MTISNANYAIEIGMRATAYNMSAQPTMDIRRIAQPGDGSRAGRAKASRRLNATVYSLASLTEISMGEDANNGAVTVDAMNACIQIETLGGTEAENARAIALLTRVAKAALKARAA